MYDGTSVVEGVAARRAAGPEEARAVLAAGEVPVLADPGADILKELPFDAVVDAILAKCNLGTNITDAPIVLALGPRLCRRGGLPRGWWRPSGGHDLGRLILSGSAAPNTGVPGNVGGYTVERLIRAPADGLFEPLAAIGDRVEAGQDVARVAGETARARITGVVRGMLPAGLTVTKGMKAGDIDPRCEARHCFTVSDKAPGHRRRGAGGPAVFRKGEGVMERLILCGGGARVPGTGPHGRPAGI